MRAVPHMSRSLRGRAIEKRYLAALATWPAMAELRADARANVLDFAKQLARCADYATGTSRPTRAKLCRITGRSESTWKASRRRLEAWGFLGTVAPGCKYWRGETPEGEPAETRCDAAVYVLCLPKSAIPGQPAAAASPRTRPPTRYRKVASHDPRAREAPEDGPRSARADFRDRPGRADAARGPACSAASSAAVADAIRTGPGQTISDGWVSFLAAPFLGGGWTPRDLQHAINYRPSGEQHRSDLRNIRKPAQWLRWRLSLWLNPEDAAAVLPVWDADRGRQTTAPLAWRKARPIRSHGQQLADASARRRARQEAARAAAASTAAAAVPPPAGWARRAIEDARRRPFIPGEPSPARAARDDRLRSSRTESRSAGRLPRSDASGRPRPEARSHSHPGAASPRPFPRAMRRSDQPTPGTGQ